MKTNRECVYNVSVSIEERIRNRNDWKLYLSDHYWVLDMDDCMEFYLHPLHFLGKISKSELPPRVTDNICKHCKCFTDADRKNTEYQATLQSTPLRLRNLDHTMKIGNWFYAQGHNYVTLDGKFICDDPYFEGRERICDIEKLSWNYVYDMLRMTSSTKTHHYLRTLYDLPCFYGVSSTDLVIRPLLDFQWNSQQWKYDFEECTRQIRRYGDEKAMTILRYMRKEVFQHTVFLARQGSYEASNGEKTALPDSDKMRSETVLYDKKLPRNIEPRFSATTITVENIDCLVAARQMQNRGLNPAVLNMANRQTPGGRCIRRSRGAGGKFVQTNKSVPIYVSVCTICTAVRYYPSSLSISYGTKPRRCIFTGCGGFQRRRKRRLSFVRSLLSDCSDFCFRHEPPVTNASGKDFSRFDRRR